MHLLRIMTSPILALALVASVVLGCGSKQKPSTTETTSTAPQPPAPPPPAPVFEEMTEESEQDELAAPEESGEEELFTPVYFEYDSSVLGAEARQHLADVAEYLAQNPDATLLVEGHCDERGTTEYNIGLGERRAQAIRDYLVRLGVDGTRISTISYGEERPAVAGHDEMAWAMNRRGELVLDSAPQ